MNNDFDFHEFDPSMYLEDAYEEPAQEIKVEYQPMEPVKRVAPVVV